MMKMRVGLRLAKSAADCGFPVSARLAMIPLA